MSESQIPMSVASAIPVRSRPVAPPSDRLRRLGLRLSLAGGLAGAVALPSEARAGTINVGLLGIDGASVPGGMGPAVTDALRRHLPTLQGMRVEMSQDLAEIKMVFNCTDEAPACMAKVGRSLGVQRLIYGSIKKPTPPATQYTVAIKQLNVADSTVEKFITESVAPEMLTPANPQLDELAQRWLKLLLIDGLRGSLRITSQPAGATVLLDGTALGVTPFSYADVNVGDHVVRLELDGYTPVDRPLLLRGGQTYEVTAELKPVVAAGRGRTDWSKVTRYTSYVSGGLAAAAALAAIGTWRGYVGAQEAASTQLDSLSGSLLLNGQLDRYSSFFGSSEQLSRCADVAGLQGNPSYQGYLAECQRGNTLANATTGLWVAAGAFAAVSVTSAIVSWIVRTPEGRKPESRSTGLLQMPKLGAAISPTGVALSSEFRF